MCHDVTVIAGTVRVCFKERFFLALPTRSPAWRSVSIERRRVSERAASRTHILELKNGVVLVGHRSY